MHLELLENELNRLLKDKETIVKTIAQMELDQKKLPFIIRRPIPGGGSEYWRLKDLSVLN